MHWGYQGCHFILLAVDSHDGARPREEGRRSTSHCVTTAQAHSARQSPDSSWCTLQREMSLNARQHTLCRLTARAPAARGPACQRRHVAAIGSRKCGRMPAVTQEAAASLVRSPPRRAPARRRRCGPQACAAWRWPRRRPPAGRCSPPARRAPPGMHVRPMLGAVWGTAALSAGNEGRGSRPGVGSTHGGSFSRCVRGAGEAAALNGHTNKGHRAGNRMTRWSVRAHLGRVQGVRCLPQRQGSVSGAHTLCMHAVCPACLPAYLALR